MLGVYGGTFDPVHFGHLRTALEVKELFKLDEIRMIPCFIPSHRGSPAVKAEHRVKMLELAVTGYSGMTVDTREIERGGPSYMVDTLASLRLDFTATPIVLFIGNDAFLKLTEWHAWHQLFDYAHVVVITRPGYKLPGLEAFFQSRLVNSTEKLTHTAHGFLYFQTVTLLDISATAIRNMIESNKNPGFLLPESVIQYIRQNKLYQRK